MLVKYNMPNCCIIGDTSLVIKCSEILLEKKYRIFGIVSQDEKVKNWSMRHNIPHYHLISDIEEVLRKTKFDYLFSIVNPKILPLWLLNKPKHLAVNYHDGPLPRYAGTHSTSWAIFNNEKKHGITWHVMTETVDAGDILEQSEINVKEDESEPKEQ